MNPDESPNKSEKIEILIGNTRAVINNRFTLRRCRMFMEKCEHTSDFRHAFLEVVFMMYCDSLTIEPSGDKQGILTEIDFLKIEETELQRVLEAIVDRDTSLSKFYHELKIDDPYERLYMALNQQIRSMADHLKVSLMGSFDFSKLQASLNLQNQIKDVLGLTATNLKSLNLGLDMEKFKHLFDFPIQMQDSLKKIAESANQLIIGFQNALQKIDFEKLAQFENYRQNNETLNGFGWWYIRDFDKELLDKILDAKEKISQEEVDGIICQYYRANRCEKLKAMVKRWNQLTCFQARELDLHQIVIIHGQKYYNSSVKLLFIVMEGVTRDIVRYRNGEGYHYFSKVRQELRNILEDDNNITIWEFVVVDYILNQVDENFGGHFNPSAPEDSPDYKRDKQIHGQALGVQTEADSLKLFLQLDELYSVFYLISNQTD